MTRDAALPEAELQIAEATLRELVTGLPSIIITADLAGRIQYANRSPIPDRSVADFIGTSVFDRVAPEDVHVVRSCVQRVLASGRPDGYEMRVNRDGVRRAWSVKVGPVVQDGRTVGFSMIATEVTELKDLQSQIIVADRLASIGTLAAGVAHEINNPLTYVLLRLRSMARALAAGERPAAELLPEVEACITGAERMRAIVRDLGVFARSPTDAVEAIDPVAVLDLAIQMASSEIRSRAQLVRRVSDPPPVLGDGSRLGQVFLNLLINAAQAIEPGRPEVNEIRVSAGRAPDGRAVIEVADTGCGIRPELLSRVFEPFVTTKEVGEGTGLGLHVCSRIVRAMGGELTVESQPGRGSVFTVLLPAAPA